MRDPIGARLPGLDRRLGSPGLVLWASLAMLGCASLPRAVATDRHTPAATVGVTVYALSKGRGLPDATRAALNRARELLRARQADGTVTHLEDKRIGLEGETRLCAELTAAGAGAVLAELRQLAEGVELLTVKEEPCAQR
jgi:hypothetical protein